MFLPVVLEPSLYSSILSVIPRSYLNSETYDTVWTMLIVQVTFVSMRLESDCNHDYLLIRNGPRAGSPLMNKYCGTSVPTPILSQSNALWVEFYSDNSNEDQGFVLRLEAVYEGELVELYS